MKTRRWAFAGVVAAACLASAISACGTRSDQPGGTSSPAPASPAPASPKDVLAASVQNLLKSSFTFTQNMGEVKASGSVDPAANAGAVKVDGASQAGSFRLETLIFPDAVYVQMDFGAALPGWPSDTWFRVDTTKVENPQDFNLTLVDDADPAGAAKIFAAVVDVEKVGDRQYQGTVDLGKATDASMVDEDVVKALGSQTTVPFEAVLDEQGRLTMLRLKVPAAGTAQAQTWETSYSNFGSAPLPQKPPAGQVKDAPDSFYKMTNS